jgi:hypothetical protein
MLAVIDGGKRLARRLGIGRLGLAERLADLQEFVNRAEQDPVEAALVHPGLLQQRVRPVNPTFKAARGYAMLFRAPA